MVSDPEDEQNHLVTLLMSPNYTAEYMQYVP